MSGIATSDKLAHEVGRFAENEQRNPIQDKLNHLPSDSAEMRKQIGGEPIKLEGGKGLASNKDLFPEPNKSHQRDSTEKLMSQGEMENQDKAQASRTNKTPFHIPPQNQQKENFEGPRKDKHELPTKESQEFPTDITPEITSENLNMDQPQRPSQLIQPSSEETPKQTQSDSEESTKDQNEGEKKEGGGGVTGWIAQTIKDTEQAGGLSGWLAGTVRGTVSALLSPITGSSSTQQTQAEDQETEEKDNSQDQTQQEQTQKKEPESQQDEKKEQQPESREQPEQQSQSSASQQTIGKPDNSSLRSLIGGGKSVQLIFGGRCLAVSGKQVIVEKTAPSQSEENTFTIELLKEDEDLVRIKHGDLFLTADRNIGMLMAPEDSSKINSFHLEKNGDLFALRVHNEQKWVGVGLKVEKKDITQDQQGVELERDGQLCVEINKCYQFEIQSDHIWMRLSFL
jgi:hypothetical protein